MAADSAVVPVRLGCVGERPNPRSSPAARGTGRAAATDVVLGKARWPDKVASFCPGPPGALKRPSRSPQQIILCSLNKDLQSGAHLNQLNENTAVGHKHAAKYGDVTHEYNFFSGAVATSFVAGCSLNVAWPL